MVALAMSVWRAQEAKHSETYHTDPARLDRPDRNGRHGALPVSHEQQRNSRRFRTPLHQGRTGHGVGGRAPILPDGHRPRERHPDSAPAISNRHQAARRGRSQARRVLRDSHAQPPPVGGTLPRGLDASGGAMALSRSGLRPAAFNQGQGRPRWLADPFRGQEVNERRLYDP